MPRSGATRHSPAPSCSGGTTCTRRPTSRSRRGRCTRPTVASCPISTRTRRSFATSCSASSDSSRCSASGGPTADIESTRWIGRSALRVFERQRPTLTLVYLPHLDYNLQRFGPGYPGIARDVAAVDEVCGELIAAAERAGAAIVVLSEYGITEVSNPIHVNRALRRAGWLRVREERGREQLDPGASDAFAVADHQIAHVYVARPELVGEVAQLLRSAAGRRAGAGRRRQARSGTGSSALGRAGRDRGRATAGSPTTTSSTTIARRTIARTVDIHRKPGYDPVELFVDPQLRGPEAADRGASGAEGARHALSDGRHLARRSACAGLARPSDRPAGARSAVHHLQPDLLVQVRLRRAKSSHCCSSTSSAASLKPIADEAA